MQPNAVKTLIAVDAGVDSHEIEAALPTEGLLHVVGMAEGVELGWKLLDESSPDLLVVATAGDSERVLYLIDGASKQEPERPVVVLYTGTPNGFMQRAFAAGADDLIVLPETAEQIRFAFEKVLARRRGIATELEQGPLVCVLGPKGGTGKTLTSCNLAVAFAAAGKRTALVDLDLQFGDVGLALGLQPEQTIYDLAQAGGTLDAGKVESFLTVHPASGLRVLLAPTRPDQAGLVSVDFLRDVYRQLRASSDVVVVDTPPSFSPEVIATIDTATHLCMVATLDALSLKDSKLGLETLALMGHTNGKVKFVLNRATAKVGISREEAETILGRRPDVRVPEDVEVPRMLTEGRPVVIGASRSAAARAYAGFAGTYLNEFSPAGEGAHDNGRRRRGLFRRGRKG